ncbi:MAG: mannose-1-phosphate guanylyltransferase/mannose-6-phosphate isomerase [Oceanococcus sp.]
MLIPVILAGGSGTRLWPLSRKSHPKQFLRLTEENSLLENTILRMSQVQDLGPVLAVGGEEHRFVLSEHIRRTGQQAARIVLEPCGRNTAPAAAVAALDVAAQYGPDTLMMLCPADHVVTDTDAFLQALAVAREAAQEGVMVTFGIRPQRAETGYGYIKAGATLSGGALALDSFVEKPDQVTAQGYVDSGDYYWNGGMFLFRAGTFIQQLTLHAPDILQASQQAYEKATTDGPFMRLDEASFRACPDDSIDYAVMEKTKAAVVVPLDCGWDDVGSWAFLSQTGQSDKNGNVLQGDVLIENARNTCVRAQDRLVAAIGTENLIIVETKDAVLVSAADQSQHVKSIVAQLEQAQRSESRIHPKVYRPWGSYEGIDSGERHQVKRIVVAPGQKLSLQMHHHRSEHWIVVKGTAKVTRGEDIFLLGEDESTYIPVGTRHRLENPGTIQLEMIEVQTGSYLGEDDIVRFADDYGREQD